MTAFWLCGLAFSLSHHGYYASLDGKPATDQEWVVRFGTGFSFLVKACYAASFGIAIKQLVWALVRRTASPVSTIDALFGITTDITSLLAGGLWRRTPIIAVIGIIFWLIPLPAVITPSSISVSTAEVISTQPCDIPVLDFDKKFDWTWKSPQSALANYNETQTVNPDFPDGDEDSWRHHIPMKMGYGGPSPFVEKLLHRVFIGGQILDTPSICGPNCTYNATVPGVGYHCDVIPPDTIEAERVDNSMGSLKGAQVYHALLLIDRRVLGMVRQQERQGPDRMIEHSSEYFLCEPRRVIYDLTFSFVNNVRTIDFGKEVFLGPVPWQRFVSNGSLAASYAQTNFWAYQGLADILAQHVKGSMWLPNGGSTTSSTILSFTSLVAHQTSDLNPNETVFQALYWPRLQFRDKLTDLVRNISISLLAEPTVHVYSTVPGECRVSDLSGRWEYDAVPLWIAYGSLCFVGIVGLILGAMSISFNGCSSDVSFSRILCTTRNPALDQVTAGSRFGAHPQGEGLQKTLLQFGEISDLNHAGFGLAHEVTAFQRGKCESRLA